MIYKTFVWPNEPKTLNIKMVNDSKTYILPQIGFVRKKTGFTYRIIEGTGEFFGPKCYENFQKLSQIFNDSSSGKLIIPKLLPIKAFFDELYLISEISPELICYKFKFTQEPVYSKNNKKFQKLTAADYYIIKENQSLWDVSSKFDIPIETLLENNPEISNPYDVLTNIKIKI